METISKGGGLWYLQNKLEQNSKGTYVAVMFSDRRLDELMLLNR